ncbi:hypothetical protein [Endozoicomonas euniceicola]|uniref:Uncharacterized protein n=1 Tax=Endozoicomonas euniceicola TaxID=1234143 RepID=A0ABY6H035_9GAMM|nr:hypothetical protein [Endozoicomonas euniceicola]UYM18396.1 hypothetical protein NX720_10955 [Endozoicomonas euniceicola]
MWRMALYRFCLENDSAKKKPQFIAAKSSAVTSVFESNKAVGVYILFIQVIKRDSLLLIIVTVSFTCQNAGTSGGYDALQGFTLNVYRLRGKTETYDSSMSHFADVFLNEQSAQTLESVFLIPPRI